MREAFHEQLEMVFADLAAISREVENAVHYATEALMSGNASVAESVISADSQIDAAAHRVEEQCFELLSLQQPVATDLRTVVAALRIVSDVERMGDLSVHVAKIARLRVPYLAVPDSALPTMVRMARVAQDMVSRMTTILRERDPEAAGDLDKMDDEMDGLRRDSFTELLGADWDHGVEPAVDIALLGRYYERIADHAVEVARRVVYVVTGEHPALETTG
ncbi:MAG: phosphate signaling complex protein PhoU [Nocardioides sp.]|uniref:phosphate signaling complex protein PhoU n=1 Tax=Nocardioides sp. TaxID=35761 RepID=UPI0039E47218